LKIEQKLNTILPTLASSVNLQSRNQRNRRKISNLAPDKDTAKIDMPSQVIIENALIAYVDTFLNFVFEINSNIIRPIKHTFPRFYESFLQVNESERNTTALHRFYSAFGFATQIFFPLFVIAYFYDLQFKPVSEICVSLTEKELCLAPTSFLDPYQSICTWKVRSEYQDYLEFNQKPSCHFQVVPYTSRAVVLISLIGILVDIPVYLIVKLCTDILLSPSSNEEVKKVVEQRERVLSWDSAIKSVKMAKDAEDKVVDEMIKSAEENNKSNADETYWSKFLGYLYFPNYFLM
jgi:hypothetical protein